jgi:predicted kinase
MNGLKVERLKKQFKIGPAKCPAQAVSSLALWPGKTNFLAYPDFYEVAKLKKLFDVIEIQAQCPGDFYNNKEEMRGAINFLRQNGIEATLHFPFMDLEKKGNDWTVYQMPLVIPTASHIIPPGYNAGNYNVNFAIKPMDPQLVRDVIDFASEMKIGLATLHVSIPKSVFTKGEFERYYSLVGRLADYAQAKDFSISVETGGAKMEELARLMNLPVTFTNDIVHTVLDGLNPVEVCDLLGERISKLHLSESELGRDGHQQLKDGGNFTGITQAALTRIYEMKKRAKIQGRNYCPYVIFEAPVSESALTEQESGVISDGNVEAFSHITYNIINNQKVLIITHGLPRSGKSTIINKIARALNDSNLKVDVISTDLERPAEQHESTLDGKFVSKEDRHKVYQDVMLSRAKQCYEDDADVVAIDGTFSTREIRENFIKYARDNGYTLYIISAECPDKKVINERLENRVVSDVKIPIPSQIYKKLESEFEPLDPSEVDGATVIHYNSIDQTLRMDRPSKEPTSPVAQSVTATLMKYAAAKGNVRKSE